MVVRQAADIRLMGAEKRVLLIGGGHAHVTALRWLANNPQDGLRLALVNPGPRAAYSGMVPGVVAGHFDRHEAEIDLPALCASTGTEFVNGAVTGLAPESGMAEMDTGKTLAFDLASVDIGISSGQDTSADSSDILVKPMTPFLDAWGALKARIQPDRPFPSVAIVGGGLGGVELALAVQHFAEGNARLHIVERSNRILGKSSRALRTALEKALGKKDVTTITNAEPVRHTAGQLHLSNNQSVPADIVLWAAGAKPAPWLAESGLACNNGFPIVDDSLRSVSHPNIFVCGDTAHFRSRPLMKAGVYAVRQGPVLMRNLIHATTDAPPEEYEPQTDYLKLVSLGHKAALAEKWGICLSLPGLWALKRWIDCRFVQDS